MIKIVLMNELLMKKKVKRQGTLFLVRGEEKCQRKGIKKHLSDMVITTILTKMIH